MPSGSAGSTESVGVVPTRIQRVVSANEARETSTPSGADRELAHPGESAARAPQRGVARARRPRSAAPRYKALSFSAAVDQPSQLGNRRLVHPAVASQPAHARRRPSRRRAATAERAEQQAPAARRGRDSVRRSRRRSASPAPRWPATARRPSGTARRVLLQALHHDLRDRAAGHPA